MNFEPREFWYMTRRCPSSSEDDSDNDADDNTSSCSLSRSILEQRRRQQEMQGKQKSKPKFEFSDRLVSSVLSQIHNAGHVQVEQGKISEMALREEESNAKSSGTEQQHPQQRQGEQIVENNGVNSVPDKISSECCVCFVNLTAKYALIPCGHVSTCEECIKKINKCPNCRSVITGSLRIYG